MKQPFVITPRKGMVFGEGITRPSDSFRLLVNCKLSYDGDFIEQTPGFINNTAIVQGSVGDYYNRNTASTATESGTEKVMMLFRMSSSTWAFYKTGIRQSLAGVKLPSYRQITVPVNTGLTGGCMAVFTATTTSILSLGQLLEVEIDGATTFKWRVAGGAYTTLVPIATSVVLGATGITLYFLTTTGFTIGNEWEWIRDDACYQTEAASGTDYDRYNQWRSIFINTTLYFLDFSGRLMKLPNPGTDSPAMSAGYRPVFGTDLAFYENHLFVTNFARDTVPSAFLSGVLGCSDLNDIDQFIPTDTNEADTYSFLIGQSHPGNSAYFVGGTPITQTGIFVHEGILYVLTLTGIWWSSYGGLGNPSPFNFRPRMNFVCDNILTDRYVIQTPSGGYFVRANGVYFYNGTTLKNVSEPLSKLLFSGPNESSTRNITFGAYSITRQEVYFYWNTTTGFGTKGFLVYQEQKDAWYFIAAHFDSTAGNAICIDQMQVYLGGVRKVYTSSGLFSETLVHDYNAGASFQLPYIETQDLDFGDVSCNKDIDPVYLEASYTTTAPAGSHDTTGIVLKISARKRLKDTVSYPATHTLLDANVDGNIGLRTSGKIFRATITASVGTGKNSHGFVFHQLRLSVGGLPEVKK